MYSRIYRKFNLRDRFGTFNRGLSKPLQKYSPSSLCVGIQQIYSWQLWAVQKSTGGRMQSTFLYCDVLLRIQESSVKLSSGWLGRGNEEAKTMSQSLSVLQAFEEKIRRESSRSLKYPIITVSFLVTSTP